MRFRSITGAFRVMLSSSILHISFFVAILVLKRNEPNDVIDEETASLLNK